MIQEIDIEFPEGCNVILGQTHFIKSVEDIYEAIVNTVPGAKFGIAFCEASGDRLVRYTGTDENLIRSAIEIAKKVNCGHFFVVVLSNFYPINVLNAIKMVPEVCRIFCATANPVKVLVYEAKDGRRGVIGVIDGYPTIGVESEEKIKERKEFLRKIGYKQ